MNRQTADGSIVDDEGKVLFFSLERFVRDICQGDCCFICGRDRSVIAFNDEHVLPNWVLDRYGLIGKAINLPNKAKFRYDQYKIPCCIECNSKMGCEIEAPISRLIGGGFEDLVNYISHHGNLLLFVWMNLIFLKTHLKDKNLRFHRDLRSPPDPISGLYDWEHLHHIHDVARSFYTRCKISKEVLGSSIVIPVRSDITHEIFDFADLYAPQTILLRLGNIGLLAVLNDSGAANNILQPILERVSGELSEIQFRELFAELSFVNLFLKVRPVYKTEIYENGPRRIVAEHPLTCELTKVDMTVRGSLMHHLLREWLPNIHPSQGDRDQFFRELEDGVRTFLFDQNGCFISTPAVRLPPS